MDLGIIIEPDRQDSAAQANPLPTGDDVGLMVGKEPPGAAFIESTKELRLVLDDLSGKINTLENSLNQDVEAVRLENERLRELIQKIQTSRKENEVSQAVQSVSDEVVPSPEEPTHSSLPDNPNYHHVLQAYRAGFLDDVILLSQALDESTIGREEHIQVAYWCADAHFRRGQLDEALQVLEEVPTANHELGDDAIVLQGLIYLRQGKSREARSRFETIISQYPASDYLRLAELTIKELKHF